MILAAALALPACSRGPVLGDGLPGEISCTSCHGSVNPAPPGSSKGAAAPTDIGVGAHQLHVRDGPIRGALSCAECHPMPATVDAPGHIDGLPATVTFVALAATGGTEPRWDREAVTCFGVYCHGATLAGGSTPEPIWTYAVEPDPSRPGICGTCHGAPPPPPHPPRSECHLCHSPTVTSDGTIDVAGGHHIDGKRDVSPDLTGACGLCHPVPGTSGAHAVHHGLDPAAPEASYGDLRIAADYAATTSVYAFGCGHCHPTNPAAHMDGNVEVELSGGPPGSIKARNGGAASFDRSTRACSEVYCHSSGQEVPAFVATPAWDGGESLGCDGCHANPPRYPSGGGGTPTANSHLALNFNGYSYGHFRWHGFRTTMYSEQESMHGSHGTDSDGAAPMTCQTCHSETVDPAHTGPSGFYYLDTSGDYTLPGAVAGYSCAVAGCHTELTGEQPQAGGKVLPRRHVNGARDVVFDGRTEPPASGLPVRSALPSRAYWVGDVRVSTVPIADGGYDEPTGGRTATTLSLHLANASYDPATKVCANVACHMRAYAGTPKQAWGSPIQYENVPGDRASCVVCHVGP